MGLVEMYNYYYHELADPRLTDWPLMGSIWPNILLVFTYLYLVFYYGPRYMENRPAYELKTFIRLYNIFQVTANAYVVYEILAVYPDGTALRCDAGDYSWNPDAIRVLRACYYMSLLKVIDVIETGLFVLRKKKNQITFLHVYHHISTASFALIFVRYFSTGMAVLVPVLNGLVHVIMYIYYFLSSIEAIKKAILPIKRYVTIIQMMQFVFIMFHALVAFSPSCHVPKFPAIFAMVDVLLNFYLFYNFYKKAYLNPKKNE